MSARAPRTIFVGVGSSGITWYRCALPAMALNVEWVGVMGQPPHLQTVTGLTHQPFTYERLFDYDVVVLQQPHGLDWLRAIRELQAAGVRVLFEIDDYVQAVRKTADHGFNKSFTRGVVEGYERNMAVADGLICSTEWLGARYRAFNRRVWVCRNGIDVNRYALARPEREVVNIGWAGATGHHSAMRPWLTSVAAVMQDYPETNVVAIGESTIGPLTAVVGPERAWSIPFLPLDTYPAAMTHFDIALAPAGKGNFYRGKSDLRWLEASALGIPTVADPGVYPEIEHGVTGFHAETPAEVREHLRALVSDPALRTAIGNAARAYVTEHRSVRAMAGQWADVLRAADTEPGEVAA